MNWPRVVYHATEQPKVCQKPEDMQPGWSLNPVEPEPAAAVPSIHDELVVLVANLCERVSAIEDKLATVDEALSAPKKNGKGK